MKTEDRAIPQRYAWLREGAGLPTAAFILALAAFQIVGTHFAAENQLDRDPPDAVAIIFLIAGPLALFARRRRPVAVLLFVMATTLTYLALGYAYGPVFFSWVVALYTAVVEGHRRAAWLAAGVLLGGHVALDYLLGRGSPLRWGEASAVVSWMLVVLVVSEVARVRRERRIDAARTLEEEARRRASEERLRIARELHDVLAHNISLINVQAGVALHLIDEQPEQARTALAAIKEASRDVLREVRSTLGVLRQVDEPAPRLPTPSLSRLDELVSRAKAAGLQVDTRTTGVARHLPASVDAAAFRIIQEALTNVTRHAGSATATVTLDYGERDLTVEIENDGEGAPTAGSVKGGHGILGMRERATALGGELDAGPRPGGGFRALLDAQDDIDVVGEAGDGEEAIRLANDLVPDVVLMDIRMPGVDGLEATRRIASDERMDQVRIVILTTFDVDEYVFEALRVGASGFLVKDTEPAELIQAVRVAARGDALLSPGVTRRLIAEFAAREKDPGLGLPVQEPDRVLATVMFTDIVSSTERAAEMGDAQWRELLDRHDAVVRQNLDRHGGREVKTTGDGFLALFDGPARAIRCAVAIRDELRTMGIEVRAGIHAGEVELRGEDVGGIAVHIGARVASLGDAGDVMVSSTVKDLATGSGISLVDRGEHTLKGVPDRWRLFTVASSGSN